MGAEVPFQPTHTRTENIDTGRDTGAGRQETEKERQVLSRQRTNNSKVGFGV
jgi:hypothetical protein